MSSGAVETEIKLRFESVEEARRRIESLGVPRRSEREFEANTIFDTPGCDLRNRGELIRLRETAGRVILTWKGAGETGGRHKSRPETEVGVSDFARFSEILGHLGLQPIFRYEKFRTEYQDGESGVITLDETPIGCFVELEGAPEWIDSIAPLLGCGETDYVTSSYGRLYIDARDAAGLPHENMVFGEEYS